MKSKTSLYNRGLGKNLLKRCWPLWVIWFAALILIVPVNLTSEISRCVRYNFTDIALEAGQCLLNYAVSDAVLAAVAAPAAALLMFSFLYIPRSCGMIASLPVKRESVFVTSYLTGLAPLLLSEIATAVITLMVCGNSGYLEARYVWQWLWMVAASTVAFYGIAVFCAMLTGSIIIMPLAYIGLNILPLLIYACLTSALGAMLYGYSYPDSRIFSALSPFDGLGSIAVEYGGAYRNGVYEVFVRNSELLIYYCIAGLILSVIALLLFRKRRMETAGDTVAISALKPVFKYCAALGSACAFASVIYAMFFNNSVSASLGRVLTVVSLAVGAFMGFFAAQMILDKTVKVFRGHWKEFAVLAAIVLILGACCECDIFHYERYVPDAEDVDTAYIEYAGETAYKEPENIEKVIALHGSIIENKAVNEEPGSEYDVLGITYKLKNGKTVSRSYDIRTYTDGSEEVNPNLRELAEIINAQEAVQSRAMLPDGWSFDDLSYSLISGYYVQPDGTQQSQDVQISIKQAKDLYYNCIIPDSEDGHMLRIRPVQDEEYKNKRSTLYVDFEFTEDNGDSTWCEFIIYTDAERCCKWIEENTDLVIQSFAEAENAEASYAG